MSLFALPIAIAGAPLYPSTGWRSVVLWTAVAAVIGACANLVIAEGRRRAEAFAWLVDIQNELGAGVHGWDELMTLAAEGALRLTDADAACVELLDGDEVVCSVVAGAAAPFLGMRLVAADSITGECFRAGETLVCTDSEEDTHAHRDACRLVGARSLVLVPLVHGEDVKAVLIVWSSDPHDFRGHSAQLLTLFSTMVSSALVLAELFERLTSEAVTDELTGVANRRAWYQHLDGALALAHRSGQPLSVLALDLDDFKGVNDREGHTAGDRILELVSSRWQSTLRATDLLGRVGGDEFLVSLELTDEPGGSRRSRAWTRRSRACNVCRRGSPCGTGAKTLRASSPARTPTCTGRSSPPLPGAERAGCQRD